MSSLYWFSPLICSEEELQLSEPPHCHARNDRKWKYILTFLNNNHPWWRHQMQTFSALLTLCAGNSPMTGEFPSQRSETRSFDIFFDLLLNKRLSKQSCGWWFETQSPSLWRHCNDQVNGCLLYPSLCCVAGQAETDTAVVQISHLCEAFHAVLKLGPCVLLIDGIDGLGDSGCSNAKLVRNHHVMTRKRAPHVGGFPTQRGSNVATLLPLCVGNPPITIKKTTGEISSNN